ncbi:MAG: IS4 family transposase [Gemmataceae bacterium]
MSSPPCWPTPSSWPWGRAALPLLRRFAGVYVEGCTTVALPDSCAADFRGCGGATEADGLSAAKVYVRYELLTGAIAEVGFQPGRRPDVAAGQAHAALPAGALRLADLGFFDLGLLEGYTRQGVHWVSRLPAHATVAPAGGRPAGLAALLGGATADRLDLAVAVGAGGELAGRLLAWRCPPGVAGARLAKLEAAARKKGRPVGARQRVLAGWAVLITDLPASELSPQEACQLYRARWQVELLFKRLKSVGGLGRTAGARRERALCELLAKLLGQVVANWATLLRGGPLAGPSPAKAARLVQESAGLLRRAFGSPGRLAKALKELAAVLRRPRPGRRRRRTTRQRLLHPSLTLC